MAIVGSCVIPKYLRAALLVFSGFEMLSFASGQSVGDFVISSPHPVVQLVQVEQLPSKNLNFTFSNASNKTILQICVSAQRGFREMVCESGFTNGAGLTGPGETFSMNFDASGFASDGQQNSLRVNAVVYTDGSHFGEIETLDTIRSRMFGVALETKRISDLLSNGSDDSVAGLDSVLPQIGTTPPSSIAEAAETVKGQSLPGISPSVISSYLMTPTPGILEGVAQARDNVLYEIDEKKAIAASPLTESKDKQQAVLEARLHGRSDLAQKYLALHQSQISYLISFLGGRDVQ
jgi:hypothetical protein